MSLLCLPLLFCPQDATPATRPAAQEPTPAALEVTPLANEGFLLAWGEHRVLIDAFVRAPYSIYGALPPKVEARMLAG